MAIEVVLAAVAALGSLGTGLFQRFSKASAAHSENADQVTVTVVRDGAKIQKQAAMPPDQTSRVLDMVPDPVPRSRTQPSLK